MGIVKQIKKVGVIGAGTMGSAIAQRLAMDGHFVILIDKDVKQVEKAVKGIKTVIEQGVEKKIFNSEMVTTVFANMKGSIDLNDLETADLVIEAVFENFEVKAGLLREIDKIVPSDTIIATNTSSFLVADLSVNVSHPDRFIGLHYFYHAAKNRLVEIVPSAATSDVTLESIKIFCSKTSKDAIITLDTYGFAVNRFFVPWLNEAVKIHEEGCATIAEIDSVAMKIYGISMGPFALMNATGISIALHAQKTLSSFGSAYSVSPLLEQQAASGELWDLTGIEWVGISADHEKLIRDRLLGCTFYVCSQILNEKICLPVELNRGARIGLKWKHGPVELMNSMPSEKVEKLIEEYCRLYQCEEAPVPQLPLFLEYVNLQVSGHTAVITISKPEELNVLNREILIQLENKFDAAEALGHVDQIIIIGSGKAFVAGADVKFFVDNIVSDKINNILSFTTYGHFLFDKIDRSNKNVIAVLNGLTFGGGMELALCADLILAFDEVKIAFPETGIGIFPGLGGTKRTVQRIGKGLAKFLVLTGSILTAWDAYEIGLIDKIITREEFAEMIIADYVKPAKLQHAVNEHWSGISHLFEINSYRSIINGKYQNGNISETEIRKFVDIMNKKAPLAMDVAEELIENEQGTSAELDRLSSVFLTSDALLGLTTMGRNATYSGR